MNGKEVSSAAEKPVMLGPVQRASISKRAGFALTSVTRIVHSAGVAARVALGALAGVGLQPLSSSGTASHRIKQARTGARASGQRTAARQTQS